MANKNQGSGSGCAMLIALAIGLAILLWAIKIGLIVLGVVLVIAAVIGAVAVPIFLWIGVGSRSGVQAEVDEFDAALYQLSGESSRRLSGAVTRWDDIQRNRGVGTRLERAYFAESVDAGTQKLFEEVNFYVEYGEELLKADTVPGSRADRIDRLQEMDETALQLDALRRSVS